MSWRDKLQQASFRTAPFEVERAGLSSGRRLALHEYPYRDLPFAEDLGRKARGYEVEAYVLASTIDASGARSSDYMEARDALIAALESGAGPGTLVHPYLGRMQVAVRSYRLSETTREGGIARFTISFVEAGLPLEPGVAADTANLVDERSDALVEAATEDFKSWWNVNCLPLDLVTDLEEELDRTLSGLTRLVGNITGPIAAVIRAPANMAAAIIGALGQIEAIAGEPLDALDMYESLFSAGDNPPSIPIATSTRKQQARSAAALHRLVQQVAVAEACRQSAQASYPARQDALAALERLTDAIDTQAETVDPVFGQPIADAVYQALVGLRAAVAEDLRVRGAKLPSIRSYTVPTTLPALVVAHHVYGDAERADEIVARNRLRHPGFVPGGETLEVLND